MGVSTSSGKKGIKRSIMKAFLVACSVALLKPVHSKFFNKATQLMDPKSNGVFRFICRNKEQDHVVVANVQMHFWNYFIAAILRSPARRLPSLHEPRMAFSAISHHFLPSSQIRAAHRRSPSSPPTVWQNTKDSKAYVCVSVNVTLCI